MPIDSLQRSPLSNVEGIPVLCLGVSAAELQGFNFRFKTSLGSAQDRLQMLFRMRLDSTGSRFKPLSRSILR